MARIDFTYNTAVYIKINKVIKNEKLKWEKVHYRTSTMQQWTLGIKINKSNKSKIKNPAN